MIPTYTANLSEQQRTWFYAEYQHASKSEVAGVLLAIFLGGFGIHRFYLGQNGLGILYLLFSWTGIPTIIAFIECFFMPGRVRDYNDAQARYIIGGIMGSGSLPAFNVAFAPLQPAEYVAVSLKCLSCDQPVEHGAAFCPHCGAALAVKAS